MEKQKYYVPILKWKDAEKNALKLINVSLKSNLVPLLEIQDRQLDWKTKKYSKSIDKHLQDNIEDIREILKQDKFFIDVSNLATSSLTEENVHPITYLFNCLTQDNLNFIPVIHIDSQRIIYNEIKYLLENAKVKNLCIRVKSTHLSMLDEVITKITDALAINLENIQLILDLGFITNVDLTDELVNTALKSKKLNKLHSIILCSTSIPDNLGEIKKDSTDNIERHEFILWKNVNTKLNTNYKYILYGDYTIVNPNQINFNPLKMDKVANIKYCYFDYFLICRGHVLKKGTYEQYYTLAEVLESKNEFCGKDYSYGDAYIYDMAHDCKSTGNPNTWLKAGINHHITFIINQLSNLSYF